MANPTNINGVSSTSFDSIPLSIQDKIARATSRLDAKISDTLIQLLGQRIILYIIKMTEDKYHNRNFELSSSLPTYAQVEFPNQEYPVSSSTMDNQSPTTLHAYDILPIVGHFMKKDNVHLQDIILFNVQLYDSTYQTIALQVVDFIAKGKVSNVVWQEFILSLITDSTILEHPGYQAIVQDFNTRDRW